MLPAAFIMAALDAVVPLRDVHSPHAPPTHAPHDLRPPPPDFDCHAAYVVVAFVASS
jgi:hypothetical protein